MINLLILYIKFYYDNFDFEPFTADLSQYNCIVGILAVYIQILQILPAHV